MDDLKPSIPSEDTATSLSAKTLGDSDSVPAKKSSTSGACLGGSDEKRARGLKPPVAQKKRWTSASIRLRRLRS